MTFKSSYFDSIESPMQNISKLVLNQIFIGGDIKVLGGIVPGGNFSSHSHHIVHPVVAAQHFSVSSLGVEVPGEFWLVGGGVSGHINGCILIKLINEQ